MGMQITQTTETIPQMGGHGKMIKKIVLIILLIIVIVISLITLIPIKEKKEVKFQEETLQGDYNILCLALLDNNISLCLTNEFCDPDIFYLFNSLYENNNECQNINNGRIKDICTAVITDDQSYLASLKEENYEGFLFLQGIKERKKESCRVKYDNVPEERKKEEINDMLICQAMLNKDKKICYSDEILK